MMRRLLVSAIACALAACATMPPARVTAASFAVPKVTHWTLPFEARRTLVPATASTLFMLLTTADGTLAITELDATSFAIVRAVPLVDPGTFVAWVRSSDRIYVLFTHADTHRLVALDPVSLAIVAESVTKSALPLGARGPQLHAGKRGVRVSYVAVSCKRDDDACFVDETHALGSLALVKGDEGPDDAYTTTPEPPRPVDCPIHGTLVGEPLWVGRRMFIVTAGCCGGPPGGFYVCEAPE
jgi:hypothetical protein